MGLKLHTCKSCGVEENISYKAHWYRVNKGTNQCQSCAKSGGNSTSFKKNSKPWNAGIKGYGQWPKWFPKNELNPAWKGGLTSESKRFRKSPEYKMWRKSVFERDNYTCQSCKQIGRNLHADHIKPFAYHVELRLDLDNGRTLCVDCHKQTDTYLSGALKYGVSI